MSIKGGDLLLVGGGTVLLDRIQSGGPGQININRTKIYEVGNYLSVGSVADIPDLSFTAESLDASTELECLLCGVDFTTIAAGHELQLSSAIPFDVISPFKPGVNATDKYSVIGSAAIPHLTLESMSYKYGLSDNASQTATLKGDGVFYNPGTSFVQEFTGTNVAGQQCTVTNLAVPYNGDTVAGTRYALSVSLSTGERLTYGTDYTENITGAGTNKTLRVDVVAAVPVTSTIRVLYASDAAQSYPQVSHALESATRPAALRGRNIEVYVGGELLTDRWSSVQQVGVDYKVTLQKDEEFSNPNLVGQDFDVPEVSGSIDVKPRTYAELYTKVRAIAGVTTGEVVGPLTTDPLEVLIKLISPTDGTVLKQLRCLDARFNLPGFNARVQQKLAPTFAWTSDTGDFTVIHGEAAGS
jgi:hypothetical protein